MQAPSAYTYINTPYKTTAPQQIFKKFLFATQESYIYITDCKRRLQILETILTNKKHPTLNKIFF